jgi:hypothetical protein
MKIAVGVDITISEVSQFVGKVLWEDLMVKL